MKAPKKIELTKEQLFNLAPEGREGYSSGGSSLCAWA